MDFESNNNGDIAYFKAFMLRVFEHLLYYYF